MLIIYIMNTLCIVIIILILCLLFKKTSERFGLGYGKGYRTYYPPEDCKMKNNCFKGSYVRPDYGCDKENPKTRLNYSQDTAPCSLGKFNKKIQML